MQARAVAEHFGLMASLRDMQDLPHLAVALLGLKPGPPKALEIDWSEFPASTFQKDEFQAVQQRAHAGVLVWCFQEDADVIEPVEPAPLGDPAWVQRLRAQPAPVPETAPAPATPPARAFAPIIPAEVPEGTAPISAEIVHDRGERPRWVDLRPAPTAGDRNVLDCN